MNPISTLLDLKLTPKQEQLLEVLADPDSKDMTVHQKCDKADITVKTYYTYLRDGRFVKALQIRNLSDVIAFSPLVVKRVIRDSLQGKWMQQDAVLRMSGLTPNSNQQQPILNVIINQQAAPKEDLDRLILDKIIDIIPVTHSVESEATKLT